MVFVKFILPETSHVLYFQILSTMLLLFKSIQYEKSHGQNKISNYFLVTEYQSAYITELDEEEISLEIEADDFEDVLICQECELVFTFISKIVFS